MRAGDGPIRTEHSGGTERQRDLVAWALEQYEAAGLELPELQFSLYGDRAECGGFFGLFFEQDDPWRVAVCTEERFVFLHEIGHAWAEFTLTEAEKAAYVERRGMQSWNDPDTQWRFRGTEDAAETLAWGLVGDPISHVTPGGPLVEKNEAFRMLTGFDSPRIGG